MLFLMLPVGPAHLTTAAQARKLQWRDASDRAMPELPDLAILADALDVALGGRPLTGAKIAQTLVLRGTSAELAAFEGQMLLESATRQVPDLSSSSATGWCSTQCSPAGWASSRPARRHGRNGPPRSRSARDWRGRRPTSGRPQRPPTGCQRRDLGVELRYRDATRMGKIYLMPRGVTRPVAGWDEQGPDADDPDLTLDEWRERIGRHNGELKNLLRNQAFVAGIGNAYSDEILWAARLAPFRKRSSLAADEVEALYRAVREVLPWAIGELHRECHHGSRSSSAISHVHRKGGSRVRAAVPACSRSRQAASTPHSVAAASADAQGSQKPGCCGATGRQESKRILATTYFPEGLPPEYLRRWRA